MPSQMYNSAPQQSIFNMFGGYQNFIGQYNQFANNFQQMSNMSPEDTVRQMIANGQISQDRFEYARNMANTVWPYMK